MREEGEEEGGGGLQGAVELFVRGHFFLLFFLFRESLEGEEFLVVAG